MNLPSLVTGDGRVLEIDRTYHKTRLYYSVAVLDIEDVENGEYFEEVFIPADASLVCKDGLWTVNVNNEEHGRYSVEVLDLFDDPKNILEVALVECEAEFKEKLAHIETLRKRLNDSTSQSESGQKS